VASVTLDFIDTTFVIVCGGVVSLSFREVFYCIGASECYSYVSVFEQVG
jgi:L-lactate utilization protein LutB